MTDIIKHRGIVENIEGSHVRVRIVQTSACSACSCLLYTSRYTPIKSLADPKYYSHFSISRLTPAGTLKLLNYDEGDIDMGRCV